LEQQDAEPQLSEDYRIDGELVSVGAQPGHDARIGCRAGRLAQHVSVDEILHSVSVDSDAIGTK
jgi:hypothetical protein